MNRKTLISCAIAFVCSAVSTLGHAEVRAVATQGVWTVYAGQADDGKGLCTLLAYGGGRYMGMKYFAGDNKLIIHLVNTNWTAKAGISVDLTAEFDNLGAWTATARSFKTNGGDAGLEFSIPAKQMEQWTAEFERSNRLTIRFPGQQNVSDWSVSLDGSDRILKPFAKCMVTTAISL